MAEGAYMKLKRQSERSAVEAQNLVNEGFSHTQEHFFKAEEK